MTFSIVARDGDAWGVAVASRFLAAGAIVPEVRQDVGAVATQSWARFAYRAEILDALEAERPVARALSDALAGDDAREERQVGAVGPDGAATYTGRGCMPWAGGRSGGDSTTAYAIQGNILTGPEVVEAMEREWLACAGDRLDHRLLAVLLAGDSAGGDARGRQSAALLACAPGAGYDRCGILVDLRVDDHPDAPRELERMHDLHVLYFGPPEDVRPLEGELRREVAGLLRDLGRGGSGASLEAHLEAWMGEVNLETRHAPGGIDSRVLRELRRAGLQAERAGR
jgi:uncharacterized Ntn-hydrolase superfamily protein